MLADAGLLLALGFSTLLFQLIGLPLVLLFLGRRTTSPEWWAWGRVVGWLAVGLPIWFLAHTGLPANTLLGLVSVFGLLIGILYLTPASPTRRTVRHFVRAHRRQILLQEVIFLTGFLLLGLIRTFQPAVLDLEKFMNAGLLQGYLRSPTLPAVDFWLAGASINYYSFGHFLGSLLLRLWQLPVEVGFNVLVGWLTGLIALQTYGLGRILLRKFLTSAAPQSWPLFATGLTSALLIIFGGNSHPLWYWLTNLGFSGYWYPEAARFIDFTIHEFPAYSFIVSDLHAHFWSIPIVLLTIMVLWRWWELLAQLPLSSTQVWKHSDLAKHSLILGALLGVLGMTNTWDMIVYGGALTVLGIMALAQAPKKLPWLLTSALWVSVALATVIAPWYLHFTSIITGVLWVQERSPLWQLLALWSGHVSLSILAVVVAWRVFKQRPKLAPPALFLIVLGCCAWAYVLLPEIIYFKDIYPTFPRANTMFKFTFQAFIMMSILIGWLVGFLLHRSQLLTRFWRRVLLVTAGVFLLGALSYPFLGYPKYYRDFQQRMGLDGFSWLSAASPAEHEAIVWLRDIPGRPVVLEAVGDSYTQHGRVSVFSGLPTLMGWRAHQWLWRGSPELPRQRSEEARIVYETPRSQAAQGILRQYRVQFIFVGTQEKMTYTIDSVGLQALGTVVFQRDDILIIETTL